MNKFIALIALCFVASSTANYYGAPSLGVAQPYAQASNYGQLLGVVDPVFVLPNVLPPGGYGAAAPAVNLVPAAVAPQYAAAPVQAPVQLVQAVSWSAGVPAASASSRSQSSKVGNAGYGAPIAVAPRAY